MVSVLLAVPFDRENGQIHVLGTAFPFAGRFDLFLPGSCPVRRDPCLADGSQRYSRKKGPFFPDRHRIYDAVLV